MKLKKGSKAAKDYMAKIRRMKKPASEKHTDTKSHNVAIKIVSGISKKQELEKDLKKAGLKLPHGYAIEKRVRIGELTVHNLLQSNEFKERRKAEAINAISKYSFTGNVKKYLVDIAQKGYTITENGVYTVSLNPTKKGKSAIQIIKL